MKFRVSTDSLSSPAGQQLVLKGAALGKLRPALLMRHLMTQQRTWNAFKGVTAAVQLPQQDAKGIHIAAARQFALQHHLRRHVRHSALYNSGIIPCFYLCFYLYIYIHIVIFISISPFSTKYTVCDIACFSGQR